MKILFDQGTPAPLRRLLGKHSVSTAHEMGWAELDNGRLLDVAEAAFDALITTDRNLRHQQDVSRRRLAILVPPTTSWPKIRKHAEEVAAAVERLEAGSFVELGWPE